MLKLVSDHPLDGSTIEAVSEWLKEERRRHKIKSWRQVAKYAHLSPTTVTNTVKGTRPDLETVFKLADYFKVSREWLMQLADYPIQPTLGPVALLIPVLGPGSAGPGASPENIPYIPKEFEKGHNFIGVTIVGDCLAPDIKPGYTVVVDKDASPRPGNTVVVLHDNEMLVKILERRDGELWLVALQNRAPIKVDESTNIIGVVRWVGHER